MDYDSNPRPAHPAPSSRRAALQTLSKVAAGTALWGAIEIPAASAEQPALWADLDGDLGIIWGGRNRCAPEDSSCRDDGQREEEVAVAPPPAIDAFQITDRCALDVAVSGQPAGTIVIGLWGRAAPELVGTFAALCRNDLVVPGGELFGYDDSQIDQVSKGRAVSFGRVKVPAGMFRRAAKAQPEDFAPPPSDDRTPQRHDRPGLVSVPRGGASFRFLVTAGQAAAVNGGGGGGGGGLFGGPWRGLDDENVVVGQVRASGKKKRNAEEKFPAFSPLKCFIHHVFAFFFVFSSASGLSLYFSLHCSARAAATSAGAWQIRRRRRRRFTLGGLGGGRHDRCWKGWTCWRGWTGCP
ncbi:unnamed protein product [Phaeothamnion confervicola]